MSPLKLVFEPFHLGTVEIPNRIVRAAHATLFAQTTMHEDLIAYHVARAKGGVGLSFVEMTFVHPSSALPGGLMPWDESIIGEYEKLTAAVRPHGMVLFQQLGHAGYMWPGVDGNVYSSSATPNPLTGAVPIPLRRDQLAEIVASFAEAARRSEAGGIQGLEIQAAHGYLFMQFLSPMINKRDDEYGGSLENRLRLLREVLRAVRGAVSPGFPIGIRLSDSATPGGLTPAECADIVRLLEADGDIDFISGSHSTYYRFGHMVPPMEYPVGVMLEGSSAIVAAAQNIPRMVTAGRTRTLEDAEQLLRDDVADLIVINRALIADPDLVNKSRAGRVAEIRPCTGCNQGCVGGELVRGRLGCAVNPAVGREVSLSEDLIVPTGEPKKVLVVGGGPGGMEAARTAALSGHTVTLCEAGPGLGGLLAVARNAPRLDPWGDYIDWQEHEIRRLGVDVRCDTRLDAAGVLAEQPDVVIVATGSQPRLRGAQAKFAGVDIEGLGQPHVVSSVDVLTRDWAGSLPDSAFVFDDVGGNEAFSAAQWLLEHGVAVTFATGFAALAPTVDTWLRVDGALEAINDRPFRFMPRTRLLEVGADTVTVAAIYGGAPESIAADIVLLGLSREPSRALYDELRDKVPELLLVGDAKSPRDAQFAIAEGHAAGRSVLIEPWVTA